MQIILYLLDPQCLFGGGNPFVWCFYFIFISSFCMSSNDKHKNHEAVIFAL